VLLPPFFNLAATGLCAADSKFYSLRIPPHFSSILGLVCCAADSFAVPRSLSQALCCCVWLVPMRLYGGLVNTACLVRAARNLASNVLISVFLSREMVQYPTDRLAPLTTVTALPMCTPPSHHPLIYLRQL
jgi:hypothetical protein